MLLRQLQVFQNCEEVIVQLSLSAQEPKNPKEHVFDKLAGGQLMGLSNHSINLLLSLSEFGSLLMNVTGVWGLRE